MVGARCWPFFVCAALVHLLEKRKQEGTFGTRKDGYVASSSAAASFCQFTLRLSCLFSPPLAHPSP